MTLKLSSLVVWGPKFIVPRHSRDTWRPVRPNEVYCMGLFYPFYDTKVEIITLSRDLTNEFNICLCRYLTVGQNCQIRDVSIQESPHRQSELSAAQKHWLESLHSQSVVFGLEMLNQSGLHVRRKNQRGPCRSETHQFGKLAFERRIECDAFKLVFKIREASAAEPFEHRKWRRCQG